MKRILIVFPLFVFLLTIYSCGRRPSYVLSQDRMTDLLHDIQLGQAIVEGHYGNYSTTGSRDRVLNGILEKHKVTRAQLDSSLMWYSDNVEDYNDINNDVVKRYNLEIGELRAADLSFRDASIARSDAMPTIYRIDNLKSTLSFDFNARSLVKVDLSSFLFEFDVQGLNDEHRLEAGVLFVYKDTSVYNTIPVDRNAHYVIHKPALPDSSLTQIKGYIHRKECKAITPVMIYNIRYQDSTSVGLDGGLKLDPVLVKDGMERIR